MRDILKCYQVLGVVPGSSPKALKKAYRDLVKRWHPDRFPHDPQKRLAGEERIKEINLAFERIQEHRDELIALAAKRSTAPPTQTRPRHAAPPQPRPPPPPKQQERPRPAPNPPRPKTSARRPATAIPKPAPRYNPPPSWLVPWLRPVPMAVGAAVVLAGAIVLPLFFGPTPEPPIPTARDERILRMSDIEYPRSPSATELAPTVDPGGSSPSLRMPSSEQGRAAPLGSPASGLASPSNLEGKLNAGKGFSRANKVPADGSADGVLANRTRPGIETPTQNSREETVLPVAAPPPLISDALKAKFAAAAALPVQPEPRPEETPDGRYRLALQYAAGEGVAQDYAEAARLYRLAAEAGHAEAQKRLGFLYVEGRGVRQDSAEAEGWFRKAGAQGVASASFAGALLALGKTNSPTQSKGRGEASLGAPAPTEAVRSPLLKGLFRTNSTQTNRLAAEMAQAQEPTDANGQFELGRRYATGETLAQDFQMAAKWYRQAAESGHAAAQRKLGDLYASGKGVAQDFGEARKWYDKAAAGGLAGAGLVRGSASATNASVAGESMDATLTPATKQR